MTRQRIFTKGSNEKAPHSSIPSVPGTLEEQIQSLGLSYRAWRALEARVDRQLTLKELGKELDGVTKERARQVIAKGIRDLEYSQLEAIKPTLDTLEKKGKQLFRSSQLSVTYKEAIKSCTAILVSDGHSKPAREDLRLLLLAVRALWFFERTSTVEHWRQLSLFSCSIEPQIEQHPGIEECKAKQAKDARRHTYVELAQEVLVDAGKPLHWKAISSEAENLGRRAKFNPSGIFNSLIGHKEIFCRVGSGTYGLTAWGLSGVDPYTEIVAEVLKKAGKPLTYAEIHHRVNAVRAIKSGSLTLLLDLNPRFYKSIESQYGLRAWIPPREKQTLRTPKWKVEDATSLKRVQAAQNRGYNVVRIVELDL